LQARRDVRRNSLQSQIAGKRIELRKGRPWFARLHLQRQKPRDLPDQLQRIVPVEEATAVRLVRERHKVAARVVNVPGDLPALGFDQARHPGGRRAAVAGADTSRSDPAGASVSVGDSRWRSAPAIARASSPAWGGNEAPTSKSFTHRAT
jgi:hypothetical protein